MSQEKLSSGFHRAFTPMQKTDRHRDHVRKRLLATFVVFAALFLVRAFYVRQFATELLFWDQWDAEAYLLIKPFIEGNLDVSAFWASHNEHRILWSRLTSLMLFVMDGKLGNLDSAYFSAGVFALSWTLAAFFLWRSSLTSWVKVFALALIALVLMVPFDWENILVGFQSQFFYMLLFCFLSLGAAAGTRNIGLPLLTCVLASLAAVFTMASGLFVAPAAGVVLLFSFLSKDTGCKPFLLGAAALLLVFLFAFSILTSVPGHAVLRAGNAAELLNAMVIHFSWPGKPGYAALVLNFPLIVFITVKLFVDRKFEFDEKFIIGLAAFWFFQASAMSYARGHDAIDVASKYTSLLVTGAVANIWCAVRLAWVFRQRLLGFSPMLSFIWIVFLGHQFSILVPMSNAAMRAKRHMSCVEALNSSRFVATLDRIHLDQPPEHIPYPLAEPLSKFLVDRTVMVALTGAPQAASESELRAELSRDMGRFCRADELSMGERGSPISPSICQTGVPKVVSEGFDTQGANPVVKAPDNLKVHFGSGQRGDAATGSIVLGPLSAGEWVIPVVTGPDGAGQALDVVDEQGNSLLSIHGQVIPAWRGFQISTKLPYEIRVSDKGTGWGQWSAVGVPFAASTDQCTKQ